ncbi:MAG: hypothetical protein IJH39_05275 [Clostridia bacterium]|nr:hypothetical protein [Clostridia bacterium]
MIIRNNARSTIDVYDSLLYEFKNDTSNDCIVLSGFKEKYSIDELKNMYDKIIVFNLEQYWDNFFKMDNYINLLKQADEVWDYDEENIVNLSYIRDDIKLHLLKPFITIQEQEKEYDILYYGGINGRRKKILDKLVNCNFNVKTLYWNDNVFGNNINDYIAKSKCLLNIHKDSNYKLQEQARMIRWIGNGKIFSEKSIHNYLNVDEYEYDELVDKIAEYLKNGK